MAAVSSRHAQSHSRHMKHHHTHIEKFTEPSVGIRVSANIGFSAFVLVLCGLMVSSAHAQSAANFDTKTLTPDTPDAKEDAATPAVSKDVGPVSITPSRRVGVAELEPYLESMSSIFLSRNRVFDPFGQPQDPDAKPVIKASVASAVKRAAPVQITPFADIVQLIVVTTIMPGEKRFLVGTRSIKQGDRIPLSFRGKQLQVQITEVTSRQIGFKNLENGDIATRKLDMLPIGMTPGHHGITAPGMTLDRPNAPIELEPGGSLP